MNRNFSEDPLFCGAPAGVLTLLSTSPCLPGGNSCGVLVGALGEGCATPVRAHLEATSWGRLKQRYR
jgi:hypothetical protein